MVSARQSRGRTTLSPVREDSSRLGLARRSLTLCWTGAAVPDSRSSSLPLLQIRTLEGVRHTQLLPAPAAVVPAPAPPYPPKSLIRYGHGDRRSGVSLATSQPRPGPALRRFACLPTCPLALASRPSLVVAGLDCASSQWPRHANIKCARAHPHQRPPLHGVGRDAMARRRIGCLQIHQPFLANFGRVKRVADRGTESALMRYYGGLQLRSGLEPPPRAAGGSRWLSLGTLMGGRSLACRLEALGFF